MKKGAKEKFIKLEYLRKKYGFSQEQMALFLGIKATSYSQKVNRRIPLKYDEMVIITDALNKKAARAGDSKLTMDDIFFN
jgi:DNA-binding XRE family transcriptional regulator